MEYCPTWSDREGVIGELNRGREFAVQLQSILSGTQNIDDDNNNNNNNSASELMIQLVCNMLDSFTESISILTAGGDSDEASQVMETKSEEYSGESRKRPPPSTTATHKVPRGCHKRRRNSETWAKETPTLIEDGHAWRKYGQKVILKAKYPRNYFRCTHKFEQNCKATKHVQKIQEDPPLFRTTYCGHHSCKSPHQITMDAVAQDNSSIIWSFQPGPPEYNEILVSAAIKQENCHQINDKSSLTSHDYYKLPDHHEEEFATTFDHVTEFSGSGHDGISSDLYSCTASTYTSEMDTVMSFEDFFDFGDQELIS